MKSRLFLLLVFCAIVIVNRANPLEKKVDLNNSLLGESTLFTSQKIADVNSANTNNASHRKSPSIAFDGENYFIVWADYRLSSEYKGHLNSYDHLYKCDLYGARITKNGQILDPSGIIIAEDVGFQEFPDIQFDGTNYMVAWADWKVPGNYGDIYASRISKAGVVLDPGGIKIYESVLADNDVDLVYADGMYLAVWESYYYGDDYYIKAARIDTLGNVLDPVPTTISVHSKSLLNPQAAFDGTNFFIVWADYRSGNYDIKGARIDKNGTLLDPTALTITNTTLAETQPAIAFNGTHYFISWSKKVSNNNYLVEGVLVNTDGTKSAKAIVPIYDGIHPNYFSKIAAVNDSFFVVWDQYLTNPEVDNILGKRIDGSGNVIDPAPIEIAIDDVIQTSPEPIFDGENFVVVYDERTNSSYTDNIWIQKVTTQGQVSGEKICASSGQSSQVNVTTDSDGENHFIVWMDNRNRGNWDIYGTLIDDEGNVLNSNMLPIPSPDKFKQKVACKYNGTNYLVAWTTAFGVYAIRIDKTGQVLDQNVLEIATETAGNINLDITSDGVDWLVVYRENRVINQQNDNDIKGCRINNNGTILDPGGFFITEITNAQHTPVVEYDGTNYIVAWQDDSPGGANFSDAAFARVSTSGTVIDINGKPALTNSQVKFENLRLATDNKRLLLIWTELVNETYFLKGKFKNNQSENFETTVYDIYSSTNLINYPDVLFDGKNYVVVWQEQTTGIFYDVKGCLIDKTGTVLENYTIANAERNQLNPKLSKIDMDKKSGTSAVPANVLISYIGFIKKWDNKTYNNYRVLYQTNQFLPIVLLPQSPQLVYPENKDTVNLGGFEFHWKPVENAESYTLQVSVDSLFSSLVIEDFNTTDTFALFYTVANYQENTTYYWKVAANNYVGQSDWSEVWSYYDGIPVSTKEDLLTGTNFEIINSFPNPISEKYMLNFSTKEGGLLSYSVITALGNTLLVDAKKHYPSGNHNLTINFSGISPGMYFLKLDYSGNNNKPESKTFKVIKE